MNLLCRSCNEPLFKLPEKPQYGATIDAYSFGISLHPELYNAPKEGERLDCHFCQSPILIYGGSGVFMLTDEGIFPNEH